MPPSSLALRPHEPVAERVLLPGDPGRALRLAQLLLDGPRMLNHHRGLWGYSGAAADGRALTVQSTGIGGPSAAVVVEELIALGARRLVRVGTAGTVAGGPGLGSLVVVQGALCEDGASRALGGQERVAAAPSLQAALRPHGDAHGLVVSTDLLPEARAGGEPRWAAAGALAHDLETAAVLAAAARWHVAAAAVVVVARDGAERLAGEALEAAEARLGRAGAAALG